MLMYMVTTGDRTSRQSFQSVYECVCVNQDTVDNTATLDKDKNK